jgi:hypothetical protein
MTTAAPAAEPAPLPILDREEETTPPLTRSAFRLEGDFWTITYEARTLRLKHSRGLAFLAALLRDPGSEIAAAELAAQPKRNGKAESSTRAHPLRSSRGNETVRSGLGDAGELLDAQARASYKRRLAELREEVDEAERFNDSARSERLREEIEFVTAELSRAVGFGGLARRAGSHAERARVNVTRAISLALARILESHPALGEHLERTIRTGTFCSYAPDPRAPIAWET